MAANSKSFKKGDPRCNRSGRPQTFREEIRALVGKHGAMAYHEIWEIAQGKAMYKETTRSSIGEEYEREVIPNFSQRIDALKFILEHLNGKASQPIETTNTHLSVNVDMNRLSENTLQALMEVAKVALVPPGTEGAANALIDDAEYIALPEEGTK